jgi:hypothetical protein
MCGAAIAVGSVIKLKCGIVEYPSCMKGASMAEDGPALKFCHSTRECSEIII